MNVPIIMCSYHRPKDFLCSLNSLLNNTPNYDIHILDNSCGGLDKELEYARAAKCNVIKLPKNIGKGAAFKRYTFDIIKHTKYFVSIDADIQVPKLTNGNWLSTLLKLARTIENFGALAPMASRHFVYDSPEDQLKGHVNMHALDEHTKLINDGIYYNRATAGFLYLIDSAFFLSSGGYSGHKIYASDDGYLCNNAVALDKFIGFTSKLLVKHLEFDVDEGYVAWKLRNIDPKVDELGYYN